MISKFSLFLATAQYNFLRFLPGKKQQFIEFLEETSEQNLTELYCQDILEAWMDCFGIGGLLLGSVAMFTVSLVFLAVADVLIWRMGSTVIPSIVRVFSGLFCLEKFRGGQKRILQDFLILLYIATAFLAGFHWTITFLFLVMFMNIAAYTTKGGRLC